jgi:redox-sensing transcriptional repressor
MVRARTASAEPKATARALGDAPEPEPSRLSLDRLAAYHEIAVRARLDGRRTVTSALLAREIGINGGLVRRDMASIGIPGRAHVGYSVDKVAARLDSLFGLGERGNAILVGCGALGSAIARSAQGGAFERFGLRLVAVFDTSPEKIGRPLGGNAVRPMQDCKSVLQAIGVDIAILAVPSAVAQEIADWLVQQQIKAIWNFSPGHLRVPGDVAIRNEHLSTGLIQLLHIVGCGRASAAAAR